MPQHQHLVLQDGASVDSGVWIARGKVRAFVSGDASVKASGSCRIWASRRARVEASEQAQVFATDKAWVKVTGNARAHACGNVIIDLSNTGTVMAFENANVTADSRVGSVDLAAIQVHDQVIVYTYGDVRIYAYNSCKVSIYRWSQSWVAAYDSAHILNHRVKSRLVSQVDDRIIMHSPTVEVTAIDH